MRHVCGIGLTGVGGGGALFWGGFFLAGGGPVVGAPVLGSGVVGGGFRVWPRDEREVSQSPSYIWVEDDVALFYLEDYGVSQLECELFVVCLQCFLFLLF